MKKRVLFVDDEPMVLKGLERMLRNMRREWELEFAVSGAQALQRMDQEPFDVIVSDMRMPGMNGAELLNKVMFKYPKTIRIILSGHADQEVVMKCVGSTHQYLSKPCNADNLKATITRATNLENSLKNEALQSLASRMQKLPSIPSLYNQMLSALQDPDTELSYIGGIISKDLGMTALVLKLVNSSFFGLPREISSPTEATSILGLDTIKSLVLFAGLFSQYNETAFVGLKLSQEWTHGLETGALARAISNMETGDSQQADEAMVAGMLHDAGKLVMAANAAGQYEQAIKLKIEHGICMVDAETRVFGANHAELGGYLLGLWGLPVPIVEAISLHHNPSATSFERFTALTAVHVANTLIHASQEPAQSDAEEKLDRNYLERLGLWEHVDQWMRLQQLQLENKEAA